MPSTEKNMLTFIETPIFSSSWGGCSQDDDLIKLQNLLMENPEVGNVIPATGGIRKVRFGCGGKGKQGGLRVVYFNKLQDGKIYLLLAYPKSVAKDLTAEQKKTLSALVKDL